MGNNNNGNNNNINHNNNKVIIIIFIIIISFLLILIWIITVCIISFIIVIIIIHISICSKSASISCQIIMQLPRYPLQFWVNQVGYDLAHSVYAILSLMLLVANLTITKRCKKPEKWLKPWQMGTHLTVLNESYLMNTNMIWFRWFSEIFASLCFGWK